MQALALVDLQIAKAISIQLFIPAKNGSREIGALNPLRTWRATACQMVDFETSSAKIDLPCSACINNAPVHPALTSTTHKIRVVKLSQ
ncbi:MAG: hypothetical protein P1P78_15510 [Methyloprofundus sp.]|nr:hypothetical protein [Methyloprofundus sp.]